MSTSKIDSIVFEGDVARQWLGELSRRSEKILEDNKKPKNGMVEALTQLAKAKEALDDAQRQLAVFRDLVVIREGD